MVAFPGRKATAYVVILADVLHKLAGELEEDLASEFIPIEADEYGQMILAACRIHNTVTRVNGSENVVRYLDQFAERRRNGTAPIPVADFNNYDGASRPTNGSE